MSTINVSKSRENVGSTLRQKEKMKADAKKEESILDKLGTIGRRKPKREMSEEEEIDKVENEGKEAIDSSGRLVQLTVSAADLEEGEERSIVTEEGRNDPKVKEVIRLLIDWINDCLAYERIVVKDIVEDLYDGLVIQKLLEHLATIKMEVPEVSQSQEGQRQKLRIVLQYCQQVMAHPRWQQARWTAENIQKKDLCAILQLLVALAAHFRAPVRFPEHCQLQTLLVQKRDNQLYTRYVNEEITTSQDELGIKGEKDAFDTLYDHAPEKAVDVKNSLLAFVNKHLSRINLEAYDLEYSFQDGVYLVLLIGLLEGYFVPLYSYSQTPASFEQKVQNVNLAYELMQEAGLPKPKSRAEDIVNGDIKCTSRVLYGLFSKYKSY